MITIRISSLPYYLDCPRRAACNMFRTEIQNAGFNIKYALSGISAAVGTGTHAAAHCICDSLVRSGERGDLAAAQEVGIIEFRDAAARGVEYDTTTPNNNHAEQQIIILSRSYYHEIAPVLNLQDPEFETKMTARLDEETIISGKPDISDARQIRDTKTGRETSFHAQLGGYSLLKKSNKKPRPEKLLIDYLPRVPLAKKYPGAYTKELELNFSEYYAWNIIQTIKRDIAAFMKAGDPWAFMPNPKSMLCGPRYCHAFGTDFCQLGDKG
jgi:hypothetical protein